MGTVLKRGDQGLQVADVQRALVVRGYPVEVDGVLGPQTVRAVKAFQSQHLDLRGQPLVVDGQVGPLTLWSLEHPDADHPQAVDFTKLPPTDAGGSVLGRAALGAAIAELKAGAREEGGSNRGPWVRKYLAPAGLEEGNSWCASFVSWCYLQACGGDKENIPFPYCAGARALLREFKNKGWGHAPGSGYKPQPGDLVVWWRVQLAGWEGHVGLAHQLTNGMLYTIEGNKSSRVQGFSYVFSRMDKLLGFGHVPDA